MDRERSVEALILERQSNLTIADNRICIGVIAFDALSHLLAQLKCPIIVVRPGLEREMLTQSRAYLQGLRTSTSAVCRVAVVEALNSRVVVRQHFMPVAHEVVADTLLLGSELRKLLRPWGALVHRICAAGA